MSKIPHEYIWIDGVSPTPKLRSKTKIIKKDYAVFPPNWGFDGSSTNQALGVDSDCVLKPIYMCKDPLRDSSKLVLCSVYKENSPTKTNHFDGMANLAIDKYASDEFWFGFEQEYTMFKGRNPLGWPNGGYPAPQGPFYCGVGADEAFGREIVEEHIWACLDAGLDICGANAEVMPGQWEFQTGPSNPIKAGCELWIARYLLYRVAEKHGVTIKLEPKPIGGDWNGAGLHTNVSTKTMRDSLGPCEIACERLLESFKTNGFPLIYGHDYERRLTGAHETCSYKEFRWGVADRTASVRIPAHVKTNGGGYIEDRRPCANADPYELITYLMETISG